MLLAAGFGTRLRHITYTIPKCLVPINGKPLLEIWLENLNNYGINDFIINTHYLAERVEYFVNNSKYKNSPKIDFFLMSICKHNRLLFNFK